MATPSDPTSDSRPRAVSARTSSPWISPTGLATEKALSALVSFAVAPSIAAANPSAVHGWIDDRSTGAVQMYVRPVSSSAGLSPTASTPSTSRSAGRASPVWYVPPPGRSPTGPR